VGTTTRLCKAGPVALGAIDTWFSKSFLLVGKDWHSASLFCHESRLPQVITKHLQLQAFWCFEGYCSQPDLPPKPNHPSSQTWVWMQHSRFFTWPWSHWLPGQWPRCLPCVSALKSKRMEQSRGDPGVLRIGSMLLNKMYESSLQSVDLDHINLDQLVLWGHVDMLQSIACLRWQSHWTVSGQNASACWNDNCSRPALKCLMGDTPVHFLCFFKAVINLDSCVTCSRTAVPWTTTTTWYPRHASSPGAQD